MADRVCVDCGRTVGTVGVRVAGVGLLCRRCYVDTTTPEVRNGSARTDVAPKKGGKR